MHTQYIQYVMRQNRALSQLLSFFDNITLKYDAVFSNSYKVLFFLSCFLIGKDQ